MPELPEVEITKRSLSKQILLKKVKNVTIINPKLRYNIRNEKIHSIKDKIIKKIKRRSKYILIFFNNNDIILIHLGMTGRFYFTTKNLKQLDTSFYNKNNIIRKHDHLKISFNKFDLIYNDIRKFGYIKKIKKKNLLTNKQLLCLGSEPLSNKFNFEYFKKKISNRHVAIKNLIMNQSIVSGLGNIYANEVLYLSKIKPTVNGCRLDDKQIKILLRSIKTIIKNAISAGGSTINNYYNSEGKMGSYQENFKVYNKEGKSCKRKKCSGIIKRAVHSGRSIFFCTHCQS